MHTKRIIPCLDVNNGRVVKGVNFVSLRDAGDPVEIAKAYDKAGADELVFLDITASSDARGTVVDMVRKVAENVFIPFTVGGGIRTVDDFKALLREGADKISINSSALKPNKHPGPLKPCTFKFFSTLIHSSKVKTASLYACKSHVNSIVAKLLRFNIIFSIIITLFLL